ncbi:hypothetical protein MUN81_00695 [Hymenobacter sp. 5317J-9]|uniref:hypothetical protein n=1 Tax=Hymenobacter sp. 5317J-9 TaxID=2932250 RepID=UPI001FD6A54C|nr:hypothetical protein [Hymenobacter sp. 5317J-9]UOQ98024.1 hypothetical protein MUN81_00695 [Hymenobacter sp. 5317J-9]
MRAPRFLLCILLLFVSGMREAAAQMSAADSAKQAKAGMAAPGAAAAAKTAGADATTSPVQITDVYNLSSKRRDSLQLGDHVVLRVRGLAKALDTYKRKPTELRLFIDGVGFPMAPEAVDLLNRADTARVRFLLLRNPSTEPIWQLFYRVRSKLDHKAHIGIGFENGQLGEAFPQDHNIYLELVRRNELNLGLFLVGALLAVLLYLCWHSNLVRSDILRGNLNDQDMDRTDMIGKQYESVPFSLSKVQLVFWTFLILSAYLLCYLVTGELAAIPVSLLGLLGISLGGNLFSRGITSDQVNASAEGPSVNDVSKGFWRDILAEQNRFSIARIQFLLFNLLVGLYFVRHVWRLWNIPPLDEGLLGLISISTTGFLFGKYQESKPASPDAAAAKEVAGVPGAPVGAGPVVQRTLAGSGGATTIVNVTPASASSSGTSANGGLAPGASPAPAAPAPTVLPDGTPTRRDDEGDDNEAQPPVGTLGGAPDASLAMG